MVSVIIPARNEVYLQKTIESVCNAAEGDYEVIAVLDGYWPEIPIQDHPNVKLIHHTTPIGQRHSVNEAARIANGKYIMKLDAHCNVAKGFDVVLAQDCEYDWTVIPRMYNLDKETWEPKYHKRTDYMYIGLRENGELRAEYYQNGNRQPDHPEMIDDIMCCMGPCFFMHKDRYWELGGLDENHGHWGQMGIEVACKAWLSGGALKVNKKTWFAHWFRGGSGPGFPYPISGREVDNARSYSKDLWLNGKWDKQVRSFQWLVDKFNPPGWKEQDLTILFYTANVIHKGIEYSVLRSLKKHGYPIVSVSQVPMDLGKNIVVPKERSLQNIYRQVLRGAKEAKTKYVALCEDDCLYVPDHFKYRPKNAPFAYNLNRWLLHLDEKIFSFRDKAILSQCIADREKLIECLEKGDRDREMGRDDGYAFETFKTDEPNLVFCHNRNTSGRKYVGSEPKTEVPPWGTVDYWVSKMTGRGYYAKAL